MPRGRNKMDNKSDYQLLIMKYTIEYNNQDSDDNTNNLTADLTGMIASIMDQIKISKASPDKKDPPKAQDNTTVVSDNKKSPQLKCGNSTKIGGMWTLKHEIRSPKLYELLINT